MPGIPRRALGEEAVSPAKMIQGLWVPAYFDMKFPSFPPILTAANADLGSYGPPTGGTGDENRAHFIGNTSMVALYKILGAGQTILGPYNQESNENLEAGLDGAASEGVEYLFGGMGHNTGAGNPFGTTVGDATKRWNGDRFIRIEQFNQLVANVGECAVGFRKAEDFQALIDDYDEMACVNVQTGTVNIETILNGNTTVTTDTGETVANSVYFVTEVRTRGRDVFFYHNGQKFETGFQFDVGEKIVPFAHFLQNGSGASGWRWRRLTIGNVYDEYESLQF